MICDATFTKAWSLKQHMSLHETNPTNLQCSECDFVASSKSRMQAHLASHEESDALKNEIDEETFTFMEDVTEDTDQDTYNLVEIQSSY